jgi:peptidoglycan/LPS O-acetylase OafA/YrhL
MTYRHDIDGLRGLAVLSVIFFHAGFSWFRGGFIGVDVFFVISGYLITSIIQKEIDESHFTLANFYERRVRRIMPALFVTIVGTWIVALLLYMPPEFKSYSASVATTATFVSNILFWRQGGYFAGPAEIKPLLNIWSLAVEEQFYLLFPVTMIFLARFGHKTRLLVISLVLLISLALSIWGTFHAPGAAFFLTPSRAWELMLGAVLAFDFLKVKQSRWIAESAAITGLSMILWSVFFFSSTTHFPGASATTPCLGAAFLIYSGLTVKTAIGRILGSQPLVFVGLISYSLYLFHWPVFAFVRYYWILPLPVYASTAVLIFSIVAALLSWKFIEKPFRSVHGRISRRELCLGAAVASGMFLVIGLVGYVNEGFPGRYPGYVHLQYRDRLAEYNERSCFLMSDQGPSDWQSDQCLLSKRGLPIALLWGDSFAAHLAPGIKANASLMDYDVLQYSVASCAPILDRESSWRSGCRGAAEEALKIVRKYSVVRVILAVRWDKEYRYYDDFFASIRKTVAALHSLGVDVLIIGQSPAFTFWDSLDVQYRLKISHRFGSDFYQFLSFGREFISNIKKELAGIPLVDPMEVLCRPQACQILANGEPLYIDGAHFSVLGSTTLIRAIAGELNAPLGGAASAQ